MALIQLLNRMLVVSAAILCFDGTFKLVQTCHPMSKALHICLNIYLEKDFPFIETIVKSRKRGRVLLEDPDLQNICRHIVSLHDCYKTLYGECQTYWQLERYTRLMHVLQSTHTYLCANSTTNLKDLLLNSGCLARAKDFVANCSTDSGFNWLTTWKEILRMQVSPTDRCHSLEYYKTCLERQLSGIICGQEASRVYGNLLEVWLRNWCNKDSTPLGDMQYLYQPVTFKLNQTMDKTN
ncbi:uncharacterized protein TNIN_344801 [Trichonephila inaurata madagascariensis]|uniref:Secreted protein n=1 Tax=Trichonephila inaurata madagascariensis TaxID=2747483 RepID=A0A8X7BT43_9ARAC|nr:uncharacterized protein TNIN_344801 [Trichonephila inaurata madagascariensis]